MADSNRDRDRQDTKRTETDPSVQENSLQHIVDKALPPGIRPGDLWDPGSQPTEVGSDERGEARPPRPGERGRGAA